jgi:hypothetical protein
VSTEARKLDSYSCRREQNSADLNQTSTVPDKLLSHESAYAEDSFAPAGRRYADTNDLPTAADLYALQQAQWQHGGRKLAKGIDLNRDASR